MRNAAIVCCICLGVSSQDAPLYAQEMQVLRLGMRLRVTTPAHASKRIVGTVSAVDESLLTILTSKESIAVRREGIQILELSERRSRKKRGALIGAGLGVAAAIVLAATDKQEPFLSNEPLLTRGELFLGGTILFAPVGAGLGALLAPGERWVPVPPSAVGPEQPDSRRGGLQFGLRIRF